MPQLPSSLSSKEETSAGAVSSAHRFHEGFVANLPVAASVAAYGSVLGVLAAQKQITWLQLLVMDVVVFAGSAQFVMVDMWTHPIPFFEMTLAVLAINLRYLLIGASLEPVFRGKTLWHKAARMHLVADENWAVTMAAFRRIGTVSTSYLLGGGFCILAAWCFGTMLGSRLGTIVVDPQTYALDFAFVAVFTALAVLMWRGSCDLVPWVAAGTTAVVVQHFVAGKWYIVSGALVGSLAAVLSPGKWVGIGRE